MSLIEAKSVISEALVVACPSCHAEVGEPCKNGDGSLMEIKGHLGVHLFRLIKSGRARGDQKHTS